MIIINYNNKRMAVERDVAIFFIGDIMSKEVGSRRTRCMNALMAIYNGATSVAI